MSPPFIRYETRLAIPSKSFIMNTLTRNIKLLSLDRTKLTPTFSLIKKVWLSKNNHGNKSLSIGGVLIRSEANKNEINAFVFVVLRSILSLTIDN